MTMKKPLLVLAVLAGSLPALCAEVVAPSAPKVLAPMARYWPLQTGGAYALVDPTPARQIGLSLTKGQPIEAIVRTSATQGVKISGTIVETWPLQNNDVNVHVETEPGKVRAFAMSQVHAIAVDSSEKAGTVDVFDNSLRVGDRVLDVAGAVGYRARVKELHSDGTVRIGYGWLSDYADTYRPASSLVKRVRSIGGFRAGDKVINPIKGTGYEGRIKELYADGTARIGYGWLSELGDTFRHVSDLIKRSR